MKNTSLSCKILNQILQQLQNSGFEDNPVHVIGIYNNLIKKVHRAALRPVEKLRGLKQMQVYLKYTKKNSPCQNYPYSRFVNCTTGYRNRNVCVCD